jgi:hypothetical protein
MTPLADFLHAARAAGVRLLRAGDRLRLSGPAGSLTPEMLAAAATHKAALLDLLGAGGESVNAIASVTISGKVYHYRRRWAGEPLLSVDGYIALDTETDLVPLDREIPRLALASASASDESSCLIHPDDVGAFILAHRNLDFVCHHAAFDFWVLAEHLRNRGEEDACQAWWDLAATNRLHDSMLLDMLVRLARDDSYPDPRDLATVGRHYADLEISKEDPFRMRYGEIIGADWSQVEDGFFDYAAKDAIVTHLAYRAIREQALALVEQFGRHSRDILPDALERFGLLTEALQVKKAIALAQITRNGMCLDRQRLDDAEADLRQRRDEAVGRVRKICPDLYVLGEDNKLKLTPTGSPSRSTAALAAKLQAVVERFRQEGMDIRVPFTGKTRKPSTSTKFWAEYADLDEFLASWIDAEELCKMLQFFSHLREDTVHPSYVTLKRSGRTSCREPNIQQIPRDGPLRLAFVASPGHLLLAVDYSFIELRTFAATALHRYSWSDMADIIKAGVDPHANTAAMMLDVSLEEFLSWKDDETAKDGQKLKDRYAAARQAAKAVNFGVPGGLGAASLVSYAHKQFKVALTPEQAQERREALKKVYKELDLYLAEDGTAIVARNLRAPLQQVRRTLGDWHISCIRKVLEGNPVRNDGQPYKESFVDRIWGALAAVNRDPELKEALYERLPSQALARKVCQAGVTTLTGRIRGGVRYTQARNTPFQGLAADGAALALFALVKEGFRVVGFVHDEVLVELPDEGGYVSADRVRRVEEILCREMERVLVGSIPVGVESKLSRRWSKKAGLVVTDGKAFPR